MRSIFKKLSLVSLLTGISLLTAACGSQYPYSTNLKKSLDDFDTSFIKNYASGSTSKTVATYLGDDKNLAVFQHDALLVFGYQSVSQFIETLNVPSNLFDKLAASSDKTVLNSWGNDPSSRISNFKLLIENMFWTYAGLILVSAASYRYQKDSAEADLASIKNNDFSNATSYIGSYLDYLSSVGSPQYSLLSKSRIDYWFNLVLTTFNDDKLFKGSVLNTLFINNFAFANNNFTLTQLKATDAFPKNVSSGSFAYSFVATFNKTKIFNFSTIINYDPNALLAVDKKVYFHNLEGPFTL